MGLRENFLPVSEVAEIKKLSNKSDLNGQRAKALLKLNAGSSLNDAAMAADLTRGQVRYILDRYKKMGLQSLSLTPISGTKTTKEPEPEPAEKKKEKVEKVKEPRTKPRDKKKKKKEREKKAKKSKKRKLKDKEKKKEKAILRKKLEKKSKKKKKKPSTP